MAPQHLSRPSWAGCGGRLFGITDSLLTGASGPTKPGQLPSRARVPWPMPLRLSQLGLCALVASLMACAPPVESRPNILLIVVDTLRADHLLVLRLRAADLAGDRRAGGSRGALRPPSRPGAVHLPVDELAAHLAPGRDLLRPAPGRHEHSGRSDFGRRAPARRRATSPPPSRPARSCARTRASSTRPAASSAAFSSSTTSACGRTRAA